jgi:ankyrin repeat protein
VTAASRGHADVLDALAEAGASLNALSPCGARPLHAAASHGHAAAAEAIVQRAPRATAGRDARGATPLAAAVAAGAASSATEGAIVPIVELLVVSYAADTSPDALSYDDMDAGLSLTALAAPRPALLDALVRARCAAAAAASAEGVNVGGARAAERALAALREELGAVQSTQRLPPRAAATLARLRRGARSCVDDDDT